MYFIRRSSSYNFYQTKYYFRQILEEEIFGKIFIGINTKHIIFLLRIGIRLSYFSTMHMLDQKLECLDYITSVTLVSYISPKIYANVSDKRCIFWRCNKYQKWSKENFTHRRRFMVLLEVHGIRHWQLTFQMYSKFKHGFFIK